MLGVTLNREEAKNLAPDLIITYGAKPYSTLIRHFKGKGIDFTREALKQELETHPEWRNVATQEKPITTIEKIIPDRGTKEVVDEEKLASSLFGCKGGFVR